GGVEGVAIGAGARGDPRGEARAYRARYRLSFPLLIDPDAATLRQLGPGEGVPQVVVVDRAGQIRYAETGWNADSLRQTLQQTLGGAKKPRAAALRAKRRGRKR